jgi:hypothetical protein
VSVLPAAWRVATAGAVAAGVVGAQAAGQAVEWARAGRRPVSVVLVKTVPRSGGICRRRRQVPNRVVPTGPGAALVTGLTVLGGGRLVRLSVQRRAAEGRGAEWERVAKGQRGSERP